jgi:RNA-binding protein
MKKLEGFQRKYLRGIAHGLKPMILIGQKGLTPELIKIKFVDFKKKEQKSEITTLLERRTASKIVGVIGHTAILYRQQKDPEKRKVSLPLKTNALSGK